MFDLDSETWARERRRIAAAYDEPHRHYHNRRHLAEVLRVLARIGVMDPAVWLAALYHDAVYDPRSKTNEEDSVAFMHAGPVVLPPETAEFILSTKDHVPRVAGAGDLIDADLAILGAHDSRYRQYAQSIRQEYGHVSNADYRQGRARVLENFLGRERILQNPRLQEEEVRARINLQNELNDLLAT